MNLHLRAAVLGSVLPAAVLSASVLLLGSASVQSGAAPTGPATCLPHCDNALYPYLKYVSTTGEKAAGSVLPPPAG